MVGWAVRNYKEHLAEESSGEISEEKARNKGADIEYRTRENTSTNK